MKESLEHQVVKLEIKEVLPEGVVVEIRLRGEKNWMFINPPIMAEGCILTIFDNQSESPDSEWVVNINKEVFAEVMNGSLGDYNP